MVLLPPTGVLSAKDTYALFGNEAVFFILGAFILAACLMKCGLSHPHRDHHPAPLRPHAAHAAPVALPDERVHVVLHVRARGGGDELPDHRRDRARAPAQPAAAATTAARSSSPWPGARTIGGIATLLGGGRAPLALGMLRESTGQSYTLPRSGRWRPGRSSPCCWSSAWRDHQLLLPDRHRVGARRRRDHRGEGARASAACRCASGRSALVMLGTLAAWIIGGEEFGLATIALGAVVALFVLGLRHLARRRAVRELGRPPHVRRRHRARRGASTTRARRRGSRSTTGEPLGAEPGRAWSRSSPALGIVLTEAMSNSAVVALLMPVALGIAQQFGIDPRVMAPAIAVPAGPRLHPAGRHAGERDRLLVGLPPHARHARPGRAARPVAWVDLLPGRATSTGR